MAYECGEIDSDPVVPATSPPSGLDCQASLIPLGWIMTRHEARVPGCPPQPAPDGSDRPLHAEINLKYKLYNLKFIK
jgi:hypothetical protein